MHCVSAENARSEPLKKCTDDMDYSAKRRVFKQNTEQMELNVAVDKIAKAIVGVVSVMATGGSLAPVLLQGVEHFVLTAVWSKTDESSKIEEDFFEEDVYIHLEIHKSTLTRAEGCAGCSKQSFYLTADTRLIYMRAKTNVGRGRILDIKNNQIDGGVEYVNKKETWCEEDERLKREQDEKLRLERQNRNDDSCAIERCTVL